MYKQSVFESKQAREKMHGCIKPRMQQSWSTLNRTSIHARQCQTKQTTQIHTEWKLKTNFIVKIIHKGTTKSGYNNNNKKNSMENCQDERWGKNVKRTVVCFETIVGPNTNAKRDGFNDFVMFIDMKYCC